MADVATTNEAKDTVDHPNEPIKGNVAPTGGQEVQQEEQPTRESIEQEAQQQQAAHVGSSKQQQQQQQQQQVQDKQGDDTPSARQRRHRHPRLVRIVSFIVQAVLALEAAGWLYRTGSELRRRRRDEGSSSEDTSTDESEARAADAADRLVDYLSGNATAKQLMDLNSEDLLGAAELLDTDDLNELGLSKEAGAQLKSSVVDMVEEMRRARQPISPEAAGPSSVEQAAEAAGATTTSSAPQAPGQAEDEQQQQQQQQQQEEQQLEQANESRGSLPKRRFPYRQGATEPKRDSADSK